MTFLPFCCNDMERCGHIPYDGNVWVSIVAIHEVYVEECHAPHQSDGGHLYEKVAKSNRTPWMYPYSLNKPGGGALWVGWFDKFTIP